MTADTLKTTRVLELYQDFLSGKLINKQKAAEQYHVNARSIQRDIDSIRDFLSEQCAKEGIVRKIEYDKKENGYRLITQEIEQLSKGEVLALCKILLESRAFTRAQVEKQLQIILNLCVSQKEKSDIEWFISNELFNYHDPAHAAVDPDNLWMAAQAIRNQSVLEIEYQKLKDRQIVKRMVEPVGLIFSEYYFYLMAVITDHSTREAFHKKNDPYPTIYRLDRIHSIKETGEKFSVPYKDRFKEGEYKSRTQFMFGGEPQRISFNYYGPSVEAVLDKFPMAKVVDEKEGVCSIEAEVFGTGVKMWLLSQGSKVKVTAPETLVQEMKQEIENMDGCIDRYITTPIEITEETPFEVELPEPKATEEASEVQAAENGEEVIDTNAPREKLVLSGSIQYDGETVYKNKEIHFSSAIMNCKGTVKFINCTIHYNEDSGSHIYLNNETELSIMASTIICHGGCKKGNYFIQGINRAWAKNCTIKNCVFIDCVGFIGCGCITFCFDNNKVQGTCAEFFSFGVKEEAKISNSHFVFPDKPTFEYRDANDAIATNFIYCGGKNVFIL